MIEAEKNSINEEWIRKKLNIVHDNLDDIKVVALPGTYQEKICHLGNALAKFTRLKELDLSRNALHSLEGLENLKLLEKLNLYYNGINNIKELERLKFNSCLVELDLRLNPITKEENDYRLFLIHILPSLRVLDDRTIRDSEREMAATLFNQTSSNHNGHHDPKNYPKTNGYDTSNAVVARVKSVSNIAKRSAGLNENDVSFDQNSYANMLNLRMFDERDAKTTNNDNKLTYNDRNNPRVEEYSPRALKEQLDLESQSYNGQNYSSLRKMPVNGYLTSSTDYNNFNHNGGGKELNKTKSCSLLNLRELNNNDFQRKPQRSSTKSKSVHFNEIASYLDSPCSSPADYYWQNDHLHDDDDDDDEDRRRSDYFTHLTGQNASACINNNSNNHNHNNNTHCNYLPTVSSIASCQTNEKQAITNGESKPLKPALTHKALKDPDVEEEEIRVEYEDQRIFLLLDLVDRYWNGSKSLHKNFKFLNTANKLIFENKSPTSGVNIYQEQISSMQMQIKLTQDENRKLQQQLATVTSQLNQKTTNHEVNNSNVVESQSQHKNLLVEIDTLKKKCATLQEENKCLRKELNDRYEREQSLNSIESQNSSLKHDIEIMKIKLKQFEQLQQLTSMLQESHKSLVTTNEHLLQEISKKQLISKQQTTNGTHNGVNSDFYSPSFSSESIIQPMYMSVADSSKLNRKTYDQLNGSANSNRFSFK